MKWFVITNRVKSRTKFRNEPEPNGKIHFLQNDLATFPRKDKDLSVKYIGDSDSKAALRDFVKQVQAELKNRAKILKSKAGRIDRADIPPKPSLVVYAHGYNNDWTDALEEYCELRRNFHQTLGAQEYEDQCLTVLFTWPSAGKTLAYLEDRDDARASYPAVSNMVHLLFQVTNNLEDCISNVCVIAHSMGNYVFREALTALAGSPRAPAGTFIDQFVSIGADIGNTSLEPNGKGFGIVRFSNRVSVFFTPADSTLSKSKRKNGRPRLGRTLSQGFRTTPGNVLFVDCREWANKDSLQELFGKRAPSVHSSYRSVPAILSDMYYTLSGIDREMIPARKSIEMNKLYRMRAGEQNAESAERVE